MRILGIDPGTATTGFGIIEKLDQGYKVITYGCITTKANTPLPQRLNIIKQDLEELIKKYKPDCAGVEEIFFKKNIKTGIAVAQARGVILQTLTDNNLPISEFKPLEIKISVTNYGRADKGQVQRMVQILLNLEEIPKPDDAADALAIALCTSQTQKLADIMSVS